MFESGYEIEKMSALRGEEIRKGKSRAAGAGRKEKPSLLNRRRAYTLISGLIAYFDRKAG